MAAVNLLFVCRDGVFDCFDKISGFIKKKYKYQDFTYPTISDELKENTVLIIASHGNQTGILKSIKERVDVTTFAQDCILTRIREKSKISKIIFLVCHAGENFQSSKKFDQVGAKDILYFDGHTREFSVGYRTNHSIKEILSLTTDSGNWVYREKEPA